jgi:hypothetical protein
LNEALALLIEELRPAEGAAAVDGPGRSLT